MVRILLLVLSMLVGLLAISVFVRWYTAFCYRLLVGRWSEVLDDILLTGEIPNAWRRRRLVRLALRSKGAFSDILQKWILRSYLRRLSKLMTHVRHNRRLSREETEGVLEELKEVQQDWLAITSIRELQPNGD